MLQKRLNIQRVILQEDFFITNRDYKISENCDFQL
jgi:hypothetical protein